VFARGPSGRFAVGPQPHAHIPAGNKVRSTPTPAKVHQQQHSTAHPPDGKKKHSPFLYVWLRSPLPVRGFGLSQGVGVPGGKVPNFGRIKFGQTVCTSVGCRPNFVGARFLVRMPGFVIASESVVRFGGEDVDSGPSASWRGPYV
jgi:hypothetical protein